MLKTSEVTSRRHDVVPLPIRQIGTNYRLTVLYLIQAISNAEVKVKIYIYILNFSVKDKAVINLIML